MTIFGYEIELTHVNPKNARMDFCPLLGFDVFSYDLTKKFQKNSPLASKGLYVSFYLFRHEFAVGFDKRS